MKLEYKRVVSLINYLESSLIEQVYQRTAVQDTANIWPRYNETVTPPFFCLPGNCPLLRWDTSLKPPFLEKLKTPKREKNSHSLLLFLLQLLGWHTAREAQVASKSCAISPPFERSLVFWAKLWKSLSAGWGLSLCGNRLAVRSRTHLPRVRPQCTV